MQLRFRRTLGSSPLPRHFFQAAIHRNAMRRHGGLALLTIDSMRYYFFLFSGNPVTAVVRTESLL